MKTPGQYFAQILKVESSMNKHMDDPGNKYYDEQNLLRVMLKDMMEEKDLSKLTKSQLAKFISLCSSHRPCEPWMILVKLASNFERHAT